MIIKVSNKTPTKADCIIVPLQKDAKLKSHLSAFTKYYELNNASLGTMFTAKEGQNLLLFSDSGKMKICLLGLGENPNFKKIQDCFRHLGFRQKEHINKQFIVDLNFWATQKSDMKLEEKVEATANGLSLSNYELGLYKTQKKAAHPFSNRNAKLHFYIANNSLTPLQKAALRGQSLAKTQKRIFDLVNELMTMTGQIFFGLIVMAVGAFVANIAHKALSQNKENAFLASLARILVLGLFLAIALRTMGIDNDIVNLAFGLTLGAVAVAVALSFGLGGREAAGKQMEHILKNFRGENNSGIVSRHSEIKPKLQDKNNEI